MTSRPLEKSTKEIVMFPVPKELVEQFIRVYSEIKECGGCDSPHQEEFTCIVCKKEWSFCKKCDNNLGGYEGPDIEICDNCEGWICKECMRKCGNRYPRTGKGIREQAFCEYDMELGRKFHRDQDAEFEEAHRRKEAGEDVIWPRIKDYRDYSHQDKFGHFLCINCKNKIPKCEKCGSELYLCTGVSGDDCQNKPERWQELLKLHNEFTCEKRQDHQDTTN